MHFAFRVDFFVTHREALPEWKDEIGIYNWEVSNDKVPTLREWAILCACCFVDHQYLAQPPTDLPPREEPGSSSEEKKTRLRKDPMAGTFIDDS